MVDDVDYYDDDDDDNDDDDNDDDDDDDYETALRWKRSEGA